MTLLKLLATAMVAITFITLASPGFAANDGNGVSTGAPNNSQDPAAKPRRHHHHKHQQDGQQRSHRRPRNQNPDQAPANGGNGQG